MSEDDEDRTIYSVVRNEEEQYSIWPEGKDIPAGWEMAGPTGPKQECLAYIEETWTDLRPASLRRAMESAGQAPPEPPAAS